MSGIFENSKTFVDMKCKKSPDTILEEFKKFQKTFQGIQPPMSSVREFVTENFEAVGTEYDAWTPPDFKSNPSILKKISSPTYKQWASDLNQIWKQLGRKQKNDVEKNPEMYSIIPLPNPMIFESSLSREFSYNDNFYTMKGLLACEMYNVSIWLLTILFKTLFVHFSRLLEECLKTFSI